MNWTATEAAIRSHIETQWALSAYASTQLVFENENVDYDDTYVFVDIQGTFADKWMYGDGTNNLRIEGGIVFYHCFAPSGGGKQAALGPVQAMQSILELQTLANVIKLEGANPPTPAEQSDNLLPDKQPGGNYYRVSGSVPFILIAS